MGTRREMRRRILNAPLASVRTKMRCSNSAIMQGVLRGRWLTQGYSGGKMDTALFRR
jgi:hypothetical protein